MREFGVLREVLLAFAREEEQPITREELGLLLQGLDVSQADAVRHFDSAREAEQRHQAAMHIAFFAHELRNPLTSARLAMSLLRSKMGLPGAAASTRSSAGSTA